MGIFCRSWALGFRAHAVVCSLISVSRSAAVCHMFVIARWEARPVMPLLGAWNHAHGRGCARGSPVSFGAVVGGFFLCLLFFSSSLTCHGECVQHAFHWYIHFGCSFFFPIALCLAHSLDTSPGVQGCPLRGGLWCRMFPQHPAVPHSL